MSSTTAADAPLAGKTALVTGGSRGIGRACAIALSEAGARLVLLGRDLDAMTQLLKSMRRPADALAVDLRHADATRDVLGKVRTLVGGAPDIIVNNAGKFLLAPFAETDPDEFERVVAVNLTAPFIVAREFLPAMLERGSGHIVTVGSAADHETRAGNAAYAASKHGVRGLHEVLRAETRGTGVRATLVSPDSTDTSLWDDIDAGSRADIPPRDRMLLAERVADAVRFVVTRPADTNIDELRIARA